MYIRKLTDQPFVALSQITTDADLKEKYDLKVH